jgi:hypothetical protein
MIDQANDTGKWVASALSKPSEALGQHFLEAAGWYSINDVCEIFAEVTGKQILFQEVSESAFAASNGEEVCEAWILLRDYAYFGPGARERLDTSLKVYESAALSSNYFADRCVLQFLDQEPTSLKQYLVSSSPW